jgi:hypothetical protein
MNESARVVSLDDRINEMLMKANAPKPSRDVYSYWINEISIDYRNTQACIIKKAEQIVLMKQQIIDQRTFK